MSDADFRRYMKAAFPPSSWHGSPCLDEETLLAWREHRLQPEESSRVRSHVESCSSCLSTVEDMGTFFDAGESPGREETERAWALFRRRIEASRPKVAFPLGSLRRAWAPLATAAAILVITAAALTGVYMKRQADAAVADVRRRVSELENENAALRDRASAILPQPGLNATVLDLYPRDAVNRGGSGPSSVARASLAPNSAATLILHAPRSNRDAVYSLAIADGNARVVWLGSGLRAQDGIVTITIPRSFLSPGRYILTLFEKSPGGGRIAAYMLDWANL